MAQERKNGNSDKSMTAVEWLVEILIKTGELDEETNLQSILIASAKQMEKEQITTAYQTDRRPCSDEDAEQYYNETYGTTNGITTVD